MSDEFIREVNNEMRQDRLSRFWAQNGMRIIMAVVALVLLVAAIVGYRAYQQNLDEHASLRYDVMLAQNADNMTADNAQILRDFIAADNRGYRFLAQFRLAHDLVAQGNIDEAVALYDALSAQADMPLPVRDFARLNAVMALVNEADLADIEAHLAPLLQEDNHFLPLARELYGLALIMADKPLQARDILKAQLAMADLSPNIRARSEVLMQEVQLMLRGGRE